METLREILDLINTIEEKILYLDEKDYEVLLETLQPFRSKIYARLQRAETDALATLERDRTERLRRIDQACAALLTFLKEEQDNDQT